MEPSNANLENLSKAYSSAINRNRKENIKQPGLCSDYAVCLALLGQEAEANKWFNKEVSDFPTSRPYVLKMKKQLIPQYANDNTTASESDLNRLSAGDNENTDAIKSVIDEDKAKQAGTDTLDKENNTPAKEKKTPAKSKKKKSSKKK